MNRKLLVAIVSGALALPLAAPAETDVQLYGSLRYGVEMADVDDMDVPNNEEDTMWNLGSDRSSRWGIKGSMPAGEGMTAGFKMERAIGSTGSPSSMTARHHHVYLSGDFGTFTFGQQDAPYYGATTWDGAQTLGGATDFLFRSSGVSYASNTGGPFDFSVLFGSGKGGAEKAEDGANHIEASAKFAAGPINMSLGYYNDDDETADGMRKEGMQRIGGTVGGNYGPINWVVGYDSGEDVEIEGVMGDDDRYGFHLGYAIGASGNLYTQYSAQNWSDDEAALNIDADLDSWLVGYSHVLAPGVVVYGEYSSTDVSGDVDNMKVAGVDTDKAVVAVKVSF